MRWRASATGTQRRRRGCIRFSPAAAPIRELLGRSRRRGGKRLIHARDVLDPLQTEGMTARLRKSGVPVLRDLGRAGRVLASGDRRPSLARALDVDLTILPGGHFLPLDNRKGGPDPYRRVRVRSAGGSLPAGWPCPRPRRLRPPRPPLGRTAPTALLARGHVGEILTGERLCHRPGARGPGWCRRRRARRRRAPRKVALRANACGDDRRRRRSPERSAAPADHRARSAIRRGNRAVRTISDSTIPERLRPAAGSTPARRRSPRRGLPGARRGSPPLPAARLRQRRLRRIFRSGASADASSALSSRSSSSSSLRRQRAAPGPASLRNRPTARRLPGEGGEEGRQQDRIGGISPTRTCASSASSARRVALCFLNSPALEVRRHRRSRSAGLRLA